MTPRIGEDFVGWNPPGGGDSALGFVDFSIFPHLDNEQLPHNTMANAERWVARIEGPAYAIDDETAIKVTNGDVGGGGGGDVHGPSILAHGFRASRVAGGLRQWAEGSSVARPAEGEPVSLALLQSTAAALAPEPRNPNRRKGKTMSPEQVRQVSEAESRDLERDQLPPILRVIA